jgi:glycosyltransferase involved in cell wall biosynthesis
MRGRLEFFTKSHVFDIGKASRVLGFTPRVAVSEGVGRSVLWEERLALVARGKSASPRRAGAVVARPSGELRRRYGLSNDALVVGAVSRFFSLSSTRHMLDAFPRVRAAVPSARLLMVCEGAARAALESYAQRLAISPFVIFAGIRDDIAAHLRLCDVAVASSSDDGPSSAAMEARDAGVPLISMRGAGRLSIVRDDDNGLFVPFGDVDALALAVIRALRNAGLRGELAARMGVDKLGGAFDHFANPSPRAANG